MEKNKARDFSLLMAHRYIKRKMRRANRIQPHDDKPKISVRCQCCDERTCGARLGDLLKIHVPTAQPRYAPGISKV